MPNPEKGTTEYRNTHSFGKKEETRARPGGFCALLRFCESKMATLEHIEPVGGLGGVCAKRVLVHL